MLVTINACDTVHAFMVQCTDFNGIVASWQTGICSAQLPGRQTVLAFKVGPKLSYHLSRATNWVMVVLLLHGMPLFAAKKPQELLACHAVLV